MEGPSVHLELDMDDHKDERGTTVGLYESIPVPNPADKKESEKDLSWYLPLYKAALKGDWQSAWQFFNRDFGAVTAKITELSETALHVAVGSGNTTNFVKELLRIIPTDALVNLRDQAGHTALHCAAVSGNVEAARLLVDKDPGLTNAPSDSFLLPIHLAALYANKPMVCYLLTVTRDDVDVNPFTDRSGIDLLNLVILAEFYDLALYLVQLYPNLAALRSSADRSALSIIAGKPSAFYSCYKLNFWQRFLYSCVPEAFGEETAAIGMQVSQKVSCCTAFFRQLSFPGCKKWPLVLWKVTECIVPRAKYVRQIRTMHKQTIQLVKILCKAIAELDYSTAASMFEKPIISAACLGINEIVEDILEFFPSAIWSRNETGKNIFLLAVIHRQEDVFNLVYQMSKRKKMALQLRDNEGNNILHLAAKLAPASQLNLLCGAPVQMQRELQWFEEVEKHALPDFKESKNSKGRTPAIEFAIEHQGLIKEGERWMKDTANSCTLAATLIATIAFAASITVPGGNNSENGFPIFSTSSPFHIFAIFNALSLFSSTASLLMFLSILTARYSEGDFLYALPKRLIIGLVMLFLSISSMMVAFSATLYLVLCQKKGWALIPVVALACVPVTLFVTLQFPLLVDLIRFTYCPGIFGLRSKRMLF